MFHLRRNAIPLVNRVPSAWLVFFIGVSFCDVSLAQTVAPPLAQSASVTQDSALSAPPSSVVEPEPATIVSVAPETPEEPEVLGGDEVTARQSSPAEQQLARARALAAIRNYNGALQALEPLRTNDGDPTTSAVARVLLSNIYIEQADYRRAAALLDETFNANQKERQSYYTVAGQTLNSVRARLANYRAYNVDITDRSLPPEAANDLDGMRSLLETLLKQAESLQLNKSNASAKDAAALYEDVAGVRLSLARNAEEKIDWQRRLAAARQRLVAANAAPSSAVNPQPARTAKPELADLTPRATASGNSPVTHNSTPATTNINAAIATNSSDNLTRANSNAASSNSATPSNTSARASRNATAAPLVVNASSVDRTPSAASPVTSSAVNSANTNAATADIANTAAQPLNVGALLNKATNRVQPIYPASARNARTEGMVTVNLIVNEQGKVEKITGSTGPELLRRAAEDAARRWRFQPTTLNNQPTRVAGYLTFNFKQ